MGTTTPQPHRQLGPDSPEVLLRRAGAPPPPAVPRARRFLALLAVHGDEPCGVAAANRLLASGFFDAAAAAPGCPWDELRLVVGNPRALAAGKRFLDFNLNRAFGDEMVALGGAAGGGSSGAPPPYEAVRAAQLAPLIDAAGALIDIHSTSCATPSFAFYPPRDGPGGAAGTGGSSSSGGGGGDGSGGGSARAPGAPPEAALALALPVAYAVRDYTGEGLGLAIERSADAALAAGETPRAACVEAGAHGDTAAVDTAETSLRVFATGWGGGGGAGGGGGGGGGGGHAPPVHVVARVGVTVRPGFRWARGGAPPPAFSRVAAGEAVAEDDSGPIACPCPGGALVFMPAGQPRVGEDALLWAEPFAE
ncbi:hypothetical protein Rsub_08469 [Raphidocelis subcapitata]|uniref:Succinylglutamate desuccinylase/Aspartoacylase catalytic domain-containing protein n=1 Tax=Raphidocelis subcapitata TaxID=307507 RepID=A0A2V0P7N9_9CHLO|nr:hypothetical protein Rsub_08469 [Raphidocelis subcapitata]|eukprot:GBF95878.1 hypothetical protein Rsub_08469 [Raphidocelis subcapitata]